MATQYSNKPIVTNGLVYALDFGNQKSYVSGSLTTRNLVYSQISGTIYNGTTSGSLINGIFNFLNSSTPGLKIDVNDPFRAIDYGKTYTVATTIKVSSGNNNQTIFSRGDWYSSAPYVTNRFALTYENGKLIHGLNYGPTNDLGFGRGYNFNTDTLVHLTFRYSSGSWDYFVNGIPQTASLGGTYSNPSAGSLTTFSGRSSLDQNNFTGSLGNFLIYNRALSSDEIWSNYQLSAQRYGLGPQTPRPYVDENAYLFLQSAGITDPIITSSINTFVLGLKSASLWDKMIAIYPFVGTGSVGVNLTGSHKWNLKEPSLVTYPLGFTGSWNGSVSGSTPSGSGTAINTTVTPSTYYPNYSTSSAHISILSYDTPVSSSILAGTGMTKELAVSTLAGDYGTPAAAYSVRKVRTAYSGALMDVRRSIDNVTSSIGYVSNGDLDTGSLLDFVLPGRSTLPGAYSGLAAAYSLRKVSGSYTGSAVRVRGDIENQFRDIGFDASGNLNTGSLTSLVATGSNVLPGSYSGLAAAYSLRRVVPGYSGNLIEIQVGSVSQSIGMDSLGNLNTASITVFAGSNDAFVKTWYDQSGNGYHISQPSAASQPRIYSGTQGSVITQGIKPAIEFNGSSDNLVYNGTIPTAENLSAFGVFTKVTHQNNEGFFSLIPSGSTPNSRDWASIDGRAFEMSTSPTRFTFTGHYIYAGSNGFADGMQLDGTASLNTPFIFSAIESNNTASLKINGTNELVDTYGPGTPTSPNGLVIGARYDTQIAQFGNIKTSELLIYSSSQASNRTYIENNINAYYNIYTTASTSTENAFVNTWYDQSGNARHATQTTSSRQPLIVSSGSLITENGRPTLRFDGANDSLIMAGLHGQSILDQYFVTSTSDNNYNYPAGGTFIPHGFVATSGAPDLDITYNYGSPSLYANGTLFTGNTRGQIYTFLTGSKVVVHQGASTSGWTQYNFSNLSSYEYSGSLQELIAYTSSQAANRPLIENNINNYYNIYTGSNQGFVARWYDQSGNNRHATQTTAGSQPLIVESGSIITEPTSSKPALNFDGTADYFTFTPSIPAQNTYTAFTVVFPTTESSLNDMIIGGAVGSTGFRLDGGATPTATITRCSQADIVAAAISGNIPTLATFITTNSNSSIFTNNILRGTGGVVNPINPILSIGSENGSQLYKNKMQEVVFYTTDQTTNREAVEYGINNYYRLYTQPTSSNWTTSSFTIYATTSSISASINNDLQSGIASSGPLGFITVSRTGSNSLTLARNGVTSSFAVPASGALSTNLYLGAINNNGLALGSSPYNILFASVGVGLTGTDIINQDKLVNTLSYGLGRGLDSDYLNILSYARSQGFTLPSTQTQAAQNALIVELKQAGIWNKLDILYIFASDGDANFATLNWKNTSLYRATGYNSLVPNLGIYILSTDRVNTSFNPATPGINYKVTDASRYIYVNTNSTPGGRLDGSGGVSNGNSMIYGSTSQTINNVSATFNYSSLRSLLSIHITGSSLFLTRGSTTGSSGYSGTPSIVNAQQSILNSGGGGSTGIPAMYALGASMVNEHPSFVLAFDKYMNRIS